MFYQALGLRLASVSGTPLSFTLGVMSHVAIRSSSSDAELAFVAREGEYFVVEYKSTAASGRRRVWGYTDCHLLVDLVQWLAAQLRGWADVCEWKTIESDFKISFRSDSLGHVYIGIELTSFLDPESWTLSAELQTELGRLPKFASDVEKFFGETA